MNASPIHWIAGTAVVLAVSACAGEESFGAMETPSMRDARAAAVEQDEAVQRVRRTCEGVYGATVEIRELPGGHLVCRRGRPLL